MCGIAGFKGDFPPALLHQMSAEIAHRGPDGEGQWSDPGEGVGLAHRRLSIIDLSPRGAQPMTDPRETVRIVFNGEIYNYRELRAELDAEGYRFRSDSDTEVILNLYLRDGWSAIGRLNGIFAFALWDARSSELLLVRDAHGVKPLYYSHTARGVVFASELKALVRVPGLDRSLDVAALTHYVAYLYTPGEGTMLRGVRKLPPGGALIVARDGRVALRSSCGAPCAEPNPLSDCEAVTQTRLLLDQAVRRQMVADVPVGAFLSGGLDSSAIVHYARQYAAGGRLQCFTIAPRSDEIRDEGWAEDHPYARRVAVHLGVELNTIEVGAEMAEDFGWMIGQLDEPQADPAALNAFFISRLARQRGIKVLLSGAGGDDLFSGYRRHLAVQMERAWRWWPAALRGGLASAARQLPQSHPILRRCTKAFRYANWSDAERIAGHFLWLPPDELSALLSPDVRAAVAGTSVLDPMLAALRLLPVGTSRLNQTLYLDSRFFLVDHNLNYTDKMSMAAGVEARVPFLDPDLVRFAASLPDRAKQRGTTGKWVLKKAMEPYLPRDVVYRPKTGFGVPLRRWMRHELRSMIDDALSTETIARRGLFDSRAVRALVERDRSGTVDAAYPILAIVCVELWCRRFLDRT